ncbi:MAG: polymerase, partial [Actinomycetota bacterium]|nr:polymerase [Actinomycetota bacterium]
MPGKTTKKKRSKLLILDGYSLAFRAFYALPEDLQTTDGTHTNAVYGFTAMLIKVLQDEHPDFIACCLDAGAPLQRTEEFAEYKSNRSKAPDTFSSQVPLIREVLKVMHIPMYELPGHEADDIIACLAKMAAAEDIDARIVTGDRDFFQIVDGRIHVLYNRRGISDIVEMDPKAVEERYGVPPSKYVDLKALEGDTSDNLPGVPGVGTKTAAKLIQKYGSAEEAVAHASEQTPKLAQNLAEHADQVAINKKLSRLAEVPLDDVKIGDLKMGGWDLEEVRELFTSLEFRTLLERLLADLPDAAEGEGAAFELDVRSIETADSLTQLAGELASSGGFAVDTVPAVARGVPRSLAFSWGGAVACIAVGPRGVSPEHVSAALGKVLEDETVPKYVHGGREVVLTLDAIGVSLAGVHLDTHIGSYLLDPGASTYSLEEIARKYSGRELKAVEGVERSDESAQASFDLDPEDIVAVEAEDACLRALAIAEVAGAVEPELNRLGMWELYRTIENPLIF